MTAPNAPRPLWLYQHPSEHAMLEWSWVEAQLREAGTYWVVTPSEPGHHPHPRPVWAVWAEMQLHLSVGSPVINRALESGARVTVHLDSGTDVVIVEGLVRGTTSDASLIRHYDVKYDWSYDVDEYGPLTSIAPSAILAWRSAGWAGREGFQTTGRWTFAPPTD
jgi:hypothetical protein